MFWRKRPATTPAAITTPPNRSILRLFLKIEVRARYALKIPKSSRANSEANMETGKAIFRGNKIYGPRGINPETK